MACRPRKELPRTCGDGDQVWRVYLRVLLLRKPSLERTCVSFPTKRQCLSPKYKLVCEDVTPPGEDKAGSGGVRGPMQTFVPVQVRCP